MGFLKSIFFAIYPEGEARSGDQGMSQEAETEAKTMEEYCSLACSLWLAWHAFLFFMIGTWTWVKSMVCLSDSVGSCMFLWQVSQKQNRGCTFSSSEGGGLANLTNALFTELSRRICHLSGHFFLNKTKWQAPVVSVWSLFRPELTEVQRIIHMLKNIDSLNSDQIVWNECLS